MSEQLAVAKILEEELKAITADIQFLQKELVRLNAELARTPWGRRGGIKKSINNLEQQISKRTKDRTKAQENLSEAMLAVQGIDQDTGKAGAIGGAVSSSLTSVASIVGSAMGAPGQPNVQGMSSAVENVVKPPITSALDVDTRGLFNRQEEEKPKNNNMLYILIGGALLVFMMLKKK
jgi:hypothetical protein